MSAVAAFLDSTPRRQSGVKQQRVGLSVMDYTVCGGAEGVEWFIVAYCDKLNLSL